jgi:hypothetical protein
MKNIEQNFKKRYPKIDKLSKLFFICAIAGSICSGIGIYSLISFREYIWGSIFLITGILIFVQGNRYQDKWNNEYNKELLKEQKYSNQKNIEMSRKIKARISSSSDNTSMLEDAVDAPSR